MNSNREFTLIILACIYTLAMIYFGACIADWHSERTRDEAIAYALLNTPSPLDCKDAGIIDAIGQLAENGLHAKGYTLILEMDNKGEKR